MQRWNEVDRTRAVYHEYPFGDFSYGGTRENYNRPLMEFLATVELSETLVEIGCGTGFWLEVATRKGIPQDHCIGVDLAPGSAAIAAHKGFPVVCGDAIQLGIASGVAGVTICNGVLHHTVDPARAFAELVRITKPDGRIFVGVYSWCNPYFYVVHKATWPIRYLYWNCSRSVVDGIWPLAKVLLRLTGYAITGGRVDDSTLRTLLIDQMITPRVRIFTKRRLRRYAAYHTCEVERMSYTQGRLMLTAVFSVRKPEEERTGATLTIPGNPRPENPR